MKLIYMIFILFINCYLCADVPVAIISKTKGKVKYKLDSENKYHSKIHQNTPVYLNSQIQTRNKAFAKLLYLDDASVISIYPKSEIIIEGSVNEGVISKKIQVLRGVVWIHSDSMSVTKPYL